MNSWKAIAALALTGFTWCLWALPSAEGAAILRLTQNEESGSVALGVFDAQGNLEKALALGTIREKVSSNGQEFMASFGQNPSGNLVLIASPDPENPKEVTLRVNGRRIVISREAVVTIIIPVDPNTGEIGDALIRPGLVGTVTLDGRRLTPDATVSLGSGQPVTIAQDRPPAPVPLGNVTPPGGNPPGGSNDGPGFPPGGSGFTFFDNPLGGFNQGNVPPGGGPGGPTFSQVPSSVSGFLGQIGINLNPAAATPVNPDQT
ncbi:MAG: hypothetical protein SNJ84_02525 [Verrucomicrobiia bacterium]